MAALALETLSGSDLVRLYNLAVEDGAVSRFSDRKAGARRLAAALAERDLEVIERDGVAVLAPIVEEEPVVVLSAADLTEKEVAVLRALATNYYSSGEDYSGATWANCIDDASEPTGLSAKSLGGVVASLQAKGFVSCSGEGRDAEIGWTGREAFEIAKALRGSKPAAAIAKVEAPADGRTRYDHKATDAAIVSLLAEIGPCKIGAVRKLWLSRDASLASLRERQIKGMMRASVRRLEAAGQISKDGAIFAVAAR